MTAPVGSWVAVRGVWRGLHGSPDIIPGVVSAVPTMPSFVGSGSSAAAATAVTPGYPEGTLAGMAAVLVVETAAQNLPSVPTGWTHADNGTGTPISPLSTGTPATVGAVGLSVLLRRVSVDGGDPVTVGDSGDHQAARIYVFRDVQPTGALINVGVANVQTTSDATVEIPGATTTEDKCLVVAIAAEAIDINSDRFNDNFANTDLANLTKRLSVNTAAGVGGGFGVATGEKATAGSYGVTTCTILQSSAQARMSLALRPAPGTGPPPSSGFRTMISSQGFDVNPSKIGTTPTPDTLITDTSAADWIATTTGWLDRARNAGAVLVLKATPGNKSKFPDGTYKIRSDTSGAFSPTKWKARFTEFWTALGTAGQTKVRDAVRDGVLRCLYVLDDFAGESGDNAFTAVVPFEDLEDIAAHVKSVAPWLPTFARGANSYMRTAALRNGVVRQYTWLDMAQAHYRPKTDWRDGATTSIRRQVQAGVDCGLASLGWFNILNWGTGDPAKNGGFGCIAGGTASLCGSSPSEILQAGRAMLANTAVHGITLWSYSFGVTYWGRSDIQAALTTLYNESLGREADGPVNIRSGSARNLTAA